MENKIEATSAKRIEDVLKEVEKTLGINIRRISERAKESVDVLETGSYALDWVTGVGGFPRGRIIELFGPESGGKSSVALLCMASAQKRGENVLYVDAENSFSKEWAQKIGVDVDSLYVLQENCAEIVLDAVSHLTRSCLFSLIVIDSVTALAPRDELEGSAEDQNIALQARILSRELRRLVGETGKSGTTLIFVNQLRENVGVMFGNPETTPGGRALKFYASLRLRVSRDGSPIVSDGKKIGHDIKISVEKNKVGPPYRVAKTRLLYDSGFDTAVELVNLGIELGIVKQAGSCFTFEDAKFMGRAQLEEAIREDENRRQRLVEALKQLR